MGRLMRCAVDYVSSTGMLVVLIKTRLKGG